MGCPVGIGPEIVLRYFVERKPPEEYQVVVLGDTTVLGRCAKQLDIAVDIRAWMPGDEIIPQAVHVMNLSSLHEDLEWGRPTIQTGKAMAGYIEKAVQLIQQKKIAAMVTCPIAKVTLHDAGYDYPGHTEMLAELCSAAEFGMMMAGEKLRVTLVTIHTSLADVPQLINKKSVLKTIFLTRKALERDFGIKKPHIAVAGLNPHAGEGGVFGDEESQTITPAIEEARSLGLQVSGPYPPDTVFNRAVAGDFDAVVCMYHDQGLIPFKLLHFEDGVNFTMGLPIVRTSVDHGTAYDIAGKGLARPASLKAAVELAARVVVNRQKFREN